MPCMTLAILEELASELLTLHMLNKSVVQEEPSNESVKQSLLSLSSTSASTARNGINTISVTADITSDQWNV